MKKLLFILILLPILVLAQSNDQNYVKTKTYKTPTSSAITTPSLAQAVQSITYFDGLGRPIQQINHKQSGTGNDFVTHMEYDDYGRQIKEYLPIVSGQTLNYHSIDATTVGSYYSSPSIPTIEATLNPYSEKLFEASPLNRVLKQAAPGNDWAMGNGHEVRFDYQTNENGEVRLFGVGLETDYTPSLIDNVHYYVEHNLYKTITKDENWSSGDEDNHTTQEFKDKEGRVILKRTFGTSIVDETETNVAHDTYYVYDDYGNLTYVIPPLVDINDTISSNVLDGLCYQYKYDYRNRLIEKKLPGKQKEYIVYNTQDLPVATGPVRSPWGEEEWGYLITKYDAFKRVVYTGWMLIGELETFRNTVDNNHEWAESFTHDTTIDNVLTNYTNAVYPTEIKLLTINFYDSYNYANAPSLPTTIEGQTVLQNVNGLSTGNWLRILTESTEHNGNLTYVFYDSKGRTISTHKIYLNGGYTNLDSKLDFTGKPEYTFTYHKLNTSSTELVIKDTYEYTAQDRLLLHKQQITGEDEELIAKNDYDELGQLISKEVGGEDVSTYIGLQKVDYRYNIRGWLTNINNVDDLTEGSNPVDLFAFRLNYNTVENVDFSYYGKALYNGNISETYWRTNNDDIKRKYGYFYDDLNRLKSAVYQKPDNAVPVTNSYNESVTYDKNGNICTLFRNGEYDDNVDTMEIDNLSYSYDTNKKNQLVKVEEDNNNPNGFKDGINTDADYTYDDNGNMLTDQNKGITAIHYNHLNLPVQIVFGTLGKIDYIYNAGGEKLYKKVYVDSIPLTTTTRYRDGFQYKTGDILDFFPHAEGYVTKIDSVYKYVFNYTDHLGNVRLSYGYDPGDDEVKILEENNYYPFGMKHQNYNWNHRFYLAVENGEIEIRLSPPLSYKYKYNGKEYQDEFGLNMYAMDMRQYDPAIGRWVVQDPIAHHSMSPYNGFDNNPVFWADPSGGNAVKADSGYGAHTDRWNLYVTLDQRGEEDTTFDVGGNYNNPYQETADKDEDEDGANPPPSVSIGANGGSNKTNDLTGQNDGDPPTLEDIKKGAPDHPEFNPPKSGTRKVRSGNRTGWIDDRGRVWIPTDHGGNHAPHWDRENPDGTYTNVYPVVAQAVVNTGRAIVITYIIVKVVEAALSWECLGCAAWLTP